VQITAVGGFADRDSKFRRFSSLSFGRRDEKRERRSAEMCHSPRIDCLWMKDASFLRNRRKYRGVSSIPGASCMYNTRVVRIGGDDAAG